MGLPDDKVLYSIAVSDVRSVVESEGFRSLSDDEIKKVGDRMGDYIEWYDAILSALEDIVPDGQMAKIRTR
jgi:hypothetical protein